jgi:hypothetical protein
MPDQFLRPIRDQLPPEPGSADDTAPCEFEVLTFGA